MAKFVPQAEMPLSDQVKVRREKLEALRAEGLDPFVQTKFEVTSSAREIKENFDALEGKTVTLVEALPDILSAGIPVPESNEQMLRDLLAEGKVAMKTACRLSAVTDAGVTLSTPDGEENLEADTVVLAVGFTPRDSLAGDLLGAGLEVYPVGDGVKVGSVMTAVAAGYTAGRKI